MLGRVLGDRQVKRLPCVGKHMFTTQGGTGPEPLLAVQQFTRGGQQEVIRGQVTLIISLAFPVVG